MNRKERTTEIIQEFDNCASSFCQRTGGTYLELTSQYKKGEEIEDLKYRRAYIFYHSFYKNLIIKINGRQGETLGDFCFL